MFSTRSVYLLTGLFQIAFSAVSALAFFIFVAWSFPQAINDSYISYPLLFSLLGAGAVIAGGCFALIIFGAEKSMDILITHKVAKWFYGLWRDIVAALLKIVSVILVSMVVGFGLVWGGIAAWGYFLHFFVNV